MRLVRLRPEPRTLLAASVIFARSPWEQLRGLIGRRLPPGTALAIPNCPQVHTAFLRNPITIVFVTRDTEKTWQVLHRETLSPWRVSRWVSGSALALEMPADSELLYVNVGDVLATEAASPG